MSRQQREYYDTESLNRGWCFSMALHGLPDHWFDGGHVAHVRSPDIRRFTDQALLAAGMTTR
jgi:hypothetical protein